MQCFDVSEAEDILLISELHVVYWLLTLSNAVSRLIDQVTDDESHWLIDLNVHHDSDSRLDACHCHYHHSQRQFYQVSLSRWLDSSCLSMTLYFKISHLTWVESRESIHMSQSKIRKYAVVSLLKFKILTQKKLLYWA